MTNADKIALLIAIQDAIDHEIESRPETKDYPKWLDPIRRFQRDIDSEIGYLRDLVKADADGGQRGRLL